MIKDLCETILPGDKSIGLPSCRNINVEEYLCNIGIEIALGEYVDLLNHLSVEKFEKQFTNLDAALRLEIVELSKRKNNRLANMIIIHCMKAYYTDAKVLKKLPVGSVPPFPEGNVLEDDDWTWTILEPVYERGRVYRSVSS